MCFGYDDVRDTSTKIYMKEVDGEIVWVETIDENDSYINSQFQANSRLFESSIPISVTITDIETGVVSMHKLNSDGDHQ